MSPRSSPFLVACAGLSGFSAVLLGALGAHPLHERLVIRRALDAWHTAANYQLAHSVAALALLIWAAQEPPCARTLRGIGALWLVGCLLFSGSIYCLALGGPRLLGPVTPIGGLAFLAGWAGVVWLAFSLSRKTPPARS